MEISNYNENYILFTFKPIGNYHDPNKYDLYIVNKYDENTDNYHIGTINSDGTGLAYNLLDVVNTNYELKKTFRLETKENQTIEFHPIGNDKSLVEILVNNKLIRTLPMKVYHQFCDLIKLNLVPNPFFEPVIICDKYLYGNFSIKITNDEYIEYTKTFA